MLIGAYVHNIQHMSLDIHMLLITVAVLTESYLLIYHAVSWICKEQEMLWYTFHLDM